MPARERPERLGRTLAGRAAQGFTLIEVLVALVVAGLSLAALTEAAMGGLAASDVAGRTEEAVARARSHLAAVNRAAGLRAADEQGDDGGGYRWRVVVREEARAPLAEDDPTVMSGAIPGRGARAGRRVVLLYGVTVWISWPGAGARAVRLDSARIGLAAEAEP